MLLKVYEGQMENAVMKFNNEMINVKEWSLGVHRK